MKFCDKLQKIRKENNITQEQLADKLGVSRQAVSKWESGTAYPDTEKLIQISKIFNTSLDELINDNKDMNKTSMNKKMSFMEIFNLVFNFISKTFNMFWSMKFKEKIKFLFEMTVLVLAIAFVSGILTNIITEIIRRIFMFLPGNIIRGIIYIIETLLYIAWIIIGGILFVKILKTRYLDYYVIIEDDSVDKIITEEPIKELKEKKDYKIVIRDPEHSSFNFFNKLAKFFIFCLKTFSLFILIPAIFGFVTFVILLVISLVYITYGLFFNGISIVLLGGIVFAYLFIRFILTLLFNRKLSYKNMFILFIVSISLIGVGIGLSTSAFRDFEFYEYNNMEEKITTEVVEMNDNLVISDIMKLPKERIIIDNKLDDIKLDIISYGQSEIYVQPYKTYSYDKQSQEYHDVVYLFVHINHNDLNQLKNILEDLKNKKINTYDGYRFDYQIDKVYISEKNLTKIRENYQKYYE